MNILVLNHEFPPLGGGAGTASYEISKRYVKAGHAVDVVTMGFNGLPEKENISGINVYRVKSLRLKKEVCNTHEMFTYVITAIFFLSKLMKKKRYDVCHCHFIIPAGFVAWYLKERFGLNYIITVHGSDVPGYNPDRFKYEHKFTNLFLKKICKEAQAICSPSLYLKELIKDKVGDFCIEHIPNGIDLDSFKLNLPAQKKNIILSTGRILRRKGFQTLVDAVHDVELPFEVHIAGNGPYLGTLKKKALGSKTKVVFHGWIDKGSMKLLELYEKASIFVLVSSVENASIALLEGMAAKCVIITTNDTGCLETISDAGFIIEFGDYENLRDILFRLGQDETLIQSYSKKAYQRLMDKYLWERIIDKYINALHHEFKCENIK